MKTKEIKTSLFDDILADLANGNLKDYYKNVLKLSKIELILFMIYACNQGYETDVEHSKDDLRLEKIINYHCKEKNMRIVSLGCIFE